MINPECIVILLLYFGEFDYVCSHQQMWVIVCACSAQGTERLSDLADVSNNYQACKVDLKSHVCPLRKAVLEENLLWKDMVDMFEETMYVWSLDSAIKTWSQQFSLLSGGDAA